VRPAISVQGPESEVRILVHKTSIFRTHREMPRQGIISAGTVQESSFPLSAGTGHRSAKIAGRIKDQTAGPSECVGTDPLKAQWKVDYQIASDRMDVGLDSGVSAAKNI
jgi:hypothetical protein